jgi:hypothetical protein
VATAQCTAIPAAACRHKQSSGHTIGRRDAGKPTGTQLPVRGSDSVLHVCRATVPTFICSQVVSHQWYEDEVAYLFIRIIVYTEFCVCAAKKQKPLCPPITIDIEITSPTAKPPPSSSNRAAMASSSSRSELNGADSSNGGHSIKVRTPMAVPAPTRVIADVLSRGPAAMIHDRQSRNTSQEPISTPQQFSALQRVVEVDGAQIIACTPFMTPAMAFVCGYPDRSGAHHDDDATTEDAEYYDHHQHLAVHTHMAGTIRINDTTEEDDTTAAVSSSNSAITAVGAGVGGSSDDAVYAFVLPVTSTASAAYTPMVQSPRPATADTMDSSVSNVTLAPHSNTTHTNNNTLSRGVGIAAYQQSQRTSPRQPVIRSQVLVTATPQASNRNTSGNSDVVQLFDNAMTSVRMNGTIVLSPDSNVDVSSPVDISDSDADDNNEEDGVRQGSPTARATPIRVAQPAAPTPSTSNRPPIARPLMQSLTTSIAAGTSSHHNVISSNSNRVSLFTSPVSTPSNSGRQNVASPAPIPLSVNRVDSENRHPNVIQRVCSNDDNSKTPKPLSATKRPIMNSVQPDPHVHRLAFAGSVPATPTPQSSFRRLASDNAVHDFVVTPTRSTHEQQADSSSRCGSSNGTRRESSIVVL